MYTTVVWVITIGEERPSYSEVVVVVEIILHAAHTNELRPYWRNILDRWRIPWPHPIH